jgi:hypothetical protein
MDDSIRTPKHRKNQKTTKVRKPSRPIDGINHRLLCEQDANPLQATAHVPDDNAAPTRAELEAKATELGIKFDGRTRDKKLAQLIEDTLTKGD